MDQKRSIAAIIVAAGRGERAGGGVPKQFRIVAGKPVLAHSVDSFAAHPAIGEIVIVIGAGQQDAAINALAGRTIPKLVEGGASRRESVRAALEALADREDLSHVLIHDAARPFLPAEVIDRLVSALNTHSGAIPYLPVVDTLVNYSSSGGEKLLGGPADRSAVMRVQTPQAFAFPQLLAAHRNWPVGKEATDDAQIFRMAGGEVVLVEGDPVMDKLTYEADFMQMRDRFARPSTRVGMGYDVHRLVEGEKLWLCGVEVPHARGLSGHSDADVAIHALVDAILGALAEGDIGAHFPPSDPEWRGAPSSRFLEFARDRIVARGGILENVDLTLICEAPKIGPLREEMRLRLADLLDIAVEKVSLKATTTEKLGFAGREEGIAAQAIVSLSLSGA